MKRHYFFYALTAHLVASLVAGVVQSYGVCSAAQRSTDYGCGVGISSLMIFVWGALYLLLALGTCRLLKDDRPFAIIVIVLSLVTFGLGAHSTAEIVLAFPPIIGALVAAYILYKQKQQPSLPGSA